MGSALSAAPTLLNSRHAQPPCAVLLSVGTMATFTFYATKPF